MFHRRVGLQDLDLGDLGSIPGSVPGAVQRVGWPPPALRLHLSLSVAG